MDFLGFEFSVSQKGEGKWLVFRILLLLFYVIFAIAYFLVIYITRMIPLGAFIPLLLWILVFFTWRYATPDYKYTINSGVFTLFTVYHKKEKKKLSFRVADAQRIAPVSKLRDILDAMPKRNIIVATPTKNYPGAYCATFTDTKRGPCAVIFTPADEAIKILRFYNSGATDTSHLNK